MADETTLYEAMGGFDPILAVTRRWHVRCLANPDAAHPFEHGGHPQHNERLAAYLAEAFGGPALYTAGYGDESSVQRMHAGNGEHLELDEACLAEFEASLRDVGIPTVAAAQALAYFRGATEASRTYSAPGVEVPDGLPFRYATRA